MSEIARRLGIDRKTVRKYLKAQAGPPVSQPRSGRSTLLDDYRDYLRMRLAQGCTNGEVLLREIWQRGYQGGYSMLRL